MKKHSGQHHCRMKRKNKKREWRINKKTENAMIQIT